MRGGESEDHAGAGVPDRRDPAAASWLTLLFALWIAGAAVASVTVSWGAVALALPLAIVVAAAVVDVAHPLARRS